MTRLPIGLPRDAFVDYEQPSCCQGEHCMRQVSAVLALLSRGLPRAGFGTPIFHNPQSQGQSCSCSAHRLGHAHDMLGYSQLNLDTRHACPLPEIVSPSASTTTLSKCMVCACNSELLCLVAQARNLDIHAILCQLACKYQIMTDLNLLQWQQESPGPEHPPRRTADSMLAFSSLAAR